jgi:hypothetical protein
MINETELDFPKGAHEMLASYLNIVAKSQESEWRYKVITKEEFETELKAKLQNS